MKTLFLLRHAKSDWNSAYEGDHERPLNKRGRKAAATIGAYLAELGELPERVISSSAVRARETVRLASETGCWNRPIETTAGLYDVSPDDVLDLIRDQDDSCSSLLLVGHQPTWSMLLDGLVGGADVRMPTAALARIDLPIERWRNVEYGVGRLTWHVTPKQLQGKGS